MATTTRVLTANVNGTVYTANANGALEAIDTCHAGATAPTDEVANGKFWLDTSTTPGILKMYNNAAWEEIGGSTSSPTFGSLEVDGQSRFDTTAFNPSDADATAAVVLTSNGGTAGVGNLSSGLTFNKINSNRPFASIAGIQTGTDADQGGLAFFTHPASTSSNTVSEAMRLNADLTAEFTGSATFGDAVTVKADTGTGFAKFDTAVSTGSASLVSYGGGPATLAALDFDASTLTTSGLTSYKFGRNTNTTGGWDFSIFDHDGTANTAVKATQLGCDINLPFLRHNGVDVATTATAAPLDASGNIKLSKDRPVLNLDSSNSGSITNEQSAIIQYGESDNASGKIVYTGDGRAYMGMGVLVEGLPQYVGFKQYYQSDRITFTSVPYVGADEVVTKDPAGIASINTLETDRVELYSPNGLNGYHIRSNVSDTADSGMLFETPDGTDVLQIGKNNALTYHSDIVAGGKFSETHSSGFWKDTASSLALHQLRGRVMGGYAQDYNGEQRATQSGGGWSMTGDEGDNVPAEYPAGTRAQWFVGQAQMAVSCHDEGAIAVSGISRTSGSNFAVGVSGFARNQYLAPLPDTNPKNAWGVYAEAVKAQGLGARGGTWAIETGTMNFDADPGAVKVDPFNSGYAGQTKGLMLNSGGGNTNAFPIDVFLQFRGDYASGTKGSRSYAGLVAADTSLVQTVSHVGSPATGKAIMLSASSNHAITWSTAADDVITELYGAAGGQIIVNRMEAPTTTPFAIDFRKDGSSKGSIQFTSGGGVAYQSNSDERLKENIIPAAYTPSLLDDLKVRSFDWKADGHHVSHGFIAQELHKVLPNAVSEGTDSAELSSAEDVWQIDQAAIIPLLVQELQELRKRVAELELLGS